MSEPGGTGEARADPRGARTRPPSGASSALRGGFGFLDRHAGACIVAGLGVVALVTWYVTWRVPGSHWLFAARYGPGFDDLLTRIGDVHRLRAGGPLYTPNDHIEYFTYPPAAIWLFWSLTWVSTFTAEFAWTAASLLSAALMVAAAGHYACRWRWATAWAVGLLVAVPLSVLVVQSVDVHLAFGQVGLLLAAAATTDVLCVRNRWRGALVGVTAAIKLYPIVLLVLFALRREWRALWTGLGSFVAVGALAFAVLPSASATFWFHRLLGGKELQHFWHRELWRAQTSSLYSLMFRSPFTGSPPERAVGLALCAGIVVAGIYAAWRQTQEHREVGALLCLALASTIGSPVAWDHYFVWFLLVPFVAVELRPMPWWRDAALVLLGVAAVTPFTLGRNGNFSHTTFDAEWVVIFAARNGLTAVSILWIVAASVRPRARAAVPRTGASLSAS